MFTVQKSNLESKSAQFVFNLFHKRLNIQGHSIIRNTGLHEFNRESGGDIKHNIFCIVRQLRGVRAEKQGEKVVNVRVGGNAVEIMEGDFSL